MKSTHYLVFLGFLFTNFQLFSQGNFSLYQLNTTAQSHYVNPVYKPNANFYISLPLGMQSIYAFNNGFTLNNLIHERAQDDSLEIRPADAIAKMAAVNRVGVNLQNELLGFGFRVKKSYFSFGLINRTQASFSYPRDLIRFGVEGNGGDLLGKRASLDGLGFNATSYLEYGLGFNTELSDKLSVGVRVKFLSGMANVQTKKSKLGIYTDPNTFDITIDGAMEVNTSNISPFYDTNYTSDFNVFPYMANFKNSGIGIDLGASYKLTDKITFSASALDLGFINWKSNTSNYKTSDVNFTFRGIDLKEYFKDSSDFVKNFTDSLESIFSYSDNKDSYKTSLNSRIYLGGSYEITKVFSASALWYSQFSQRKYRGGVTLAANAKVNQWLTATVNYSIYGRSATNLGLGFSLRGGPIQFYCMTDNVLGFFVPQASKNVQLTFGLGILVGKPDKEKKAATRLNEKVEKTSKIKKRKKD